MGRFGALILVLGFFLTSCGPKGATSGVTAESAGGTRSFTDYVHQYEHPQFLQNNKKALAARIKLLDQAPAGATAKVLTFVWENGASTNLLAAHMCKAAKRGVNVQFMADSKYGSKVGEEQVFFDHPFNEETYQWMRNCGVKVRIYNKIPSWVNEYFTDHWGVIRDAWNRKEGLAEMKEVYGELEVSPVNRLNHRKLFYVEAPVGGKREGCFLIGGRNLGDHYLTWEDEGDQYLDSDVLLCRHMKGVGDEVTDQAKASFDELWNDTRPMIDRKYGESRVYVMPRDDDYRYKKIWFARAEQNRKLHPENPHRQDPSFRGNEEASQAVRMISLARDLRNPDQAVKGGALKRAYNWRLKKSHWWNPHREEKYETDQIRAELLEGIRKEQARITIESAYLTLDDELQNAVAGALERGVIVTLVTNSAFTLKGAERGISLVNAPFIEKMTKRFPERFRPHYLTFQSGHTLHFKGAGFTCQRGGDEGGGVRYHKKFIIGSHNFHPRSGTSDKEHALVWDEPVGIRCLEALEAKGVEVPADDVADDPVLADEEDVIGQRIKWYKKKIRGFNDRQVDLIVDYETYLRDWEELNTKDGLSLGDLKRRLEHRLLFDGSGDFRRTPAGFIERLSPVFEGYL